MEDGDVPDAGELAEIGMGAGLGAVDWRRGREVVRRQVVIEG